MAIKLKLNSKEILENQFNNVPRGYDPLEVDEYLDKIIKDYQQIESNQLLEDKEVNAFKEKIAKLESENEELKILVSKYESRLKDIKETDNVTEENIELIRKINRYEKFLFQHGFMPDKIK